MGSIHVIKKTPIFSEEQTWFHDCHANTQVRLGDKEYLCAFWAGTCEGTPDQAIWTVRCKNGSWQDPVRTKYIYQLPHWNPVLFMDKEQVLYLYYKVGLTVQTWYTLVSESRDGGYTWSEAKEAVPGDYTPRATVRNKILVASNGDYIAPTSSETGNQMDCYADISTDQGNTWTKYEIPITHKVSKALDREHLWEGLNKGSLWENDLEIIQAWDGVIQPAMWESQPGFIHALMRSTRGSIYRSDSLDYGRCWCQAYPTSLPNNCSGIDCVYTREGILAAVYNPVPYNWGKRTPLRLSLSRDNGLTFYESLDLETEEGEFSYPSVIQLEDRVLQIIYTKNRRTFVQCQVSYDK